MSLASFGARETEVGGKNLTGCQHEFMAGLGGQDKFYHALLDAKDNGRAVAVYSDSEDFQSYEVGFVEYIDTEEVVLRCLTSKGEPDGKTAVRMEQVIRLDIDTIYTKKLELLYEYRETLFDKDFRPTPPRSATLRDQLLHAMDQKYLVHVVDSNDCGPSGFLLNVGLDFIEIERIGPNGEPDGIAAMMVANVSKVHFGRKQEQLLEFLYRYNFELKRLIGN